MGAVLFMSFCFLQNKNAKGKRFIVSVTETANWRSLGDAVRAEFPGIQVPDLKESKPEPFLDNSQVSSFNRLEVQSTSINATKSSSKPLLGGH